MRANAGSTRALAEYGRIVELNPLFTQAYLKAARVLRARGDEAERKQWLERGVAALRAKVEAHTPRQDASVDADANQKAFLVHDQLRNGLRALEVARDEPPRRRKRRDPF